MNNDTDEILDMNWHALQSFFFPYSYVFQNPTENFLNKLGGLSGTNDCMQWSKEFDLFS